MFGGLARAPLVAPRQAFFASRRHTMPLATASASQPVLPLAALVRACEDAFGPRPTGSVEAVQAALRGVTAEAVGLPLPAPGFGASLASLASPLLPARVSYLPVHDSRDFQIGVFVFAQRAAIPLHDHPSMTVLSKLLYGDVEISSYDWQQPDSRANGGSGSGGRSGASGSRAAACVRDAELISGPADPLVLYPAAGGNIHSMRALTPCAVLDVIAPPYEAGVRDCTYYAEADSGGEGTAEARQKVVWLREAPEINFSTVTYRK